MLTGRVTGSMSDDGKAYEIRQYDRVLKSISLKEAKEDAKLAAAIRRNGWDEVA